MAPSYQHVGHPSSLFHRPNGNMSSGVNSMDENNGQGSSWEDFDEACAGMPTSYSNPRSTSITEFDRQKHLNACQLLHSELVKLTEAVQDPMEQAVSHRSWAFTLFFDRNSERR